MSIFWLLVRVRLLSGRNVARAAFRRSPLVTSLVCLLAALIFVGAYTGFRLCFAVASRLGGVYECVYQLTYYLFLFLVAGAVPFVGSTLLQSADYTLLFASPASPRAIVAARILDATVTNSLQFSVLGIPALAACAGAANTGAAGWLILVPLIVAFVLLPALITAASLLLALKCVGIRRLRSAITLVNAATGAVVCLTIVAEIGSHGLTGPTLAAALSGHAPGPVATSLAAHIAPSAWFAGLLVSISRGDIAGAVAASASIVAAIALLYFVCVALGGSLISAAGVSEDTGSDQPRTGGGRRLPLFSSPVAAIVAKDALHVMRDSVLLSQLGMPLVLYLVPFLVAMNTSMAQSRDELLPVAMMMTGIIVFMQTSILALSSVGIESRAFWIPMLGPVSAASVLRAKFWLSLLVSGTIVAALTVVTGIIFRLPTSAVAITCLASVVLASGLCGLGVGLSGALPRFIYENPAHRVSAWALILGFVLTVAYLMIVAILFGGASLLAIRAELGFSPLMLYGTATVASLLITVLAIAVPMSIGSARLARYEWQH